MKSFYSYCFLATLLFISSQCSTQAWTKRIVGEGPVVKKEIDIKDFNKIALLGSGNVYVTRGSGQSVVLEAQENLFEYVRSEVKDRNWKIGFKGNVKTSKPINFYITVPELSAIKLHGSGNITTESRFTANQFEIAISGSGSIRADISCTRVNCRISGSGNIYLNGNSNTAEVRISGSGDVKAMDFVSDECSVFISGSGNCGMEVRENLEARISGSGDIHYKGRPRIDSHVSGSGKVKGV